MVPGPMLRTLVFRPASRILVTPRTRIVSRSYSAATNNNSKLPTAPAGEKNGPNSQQQEHVSEEAAKMAEITGGQGPELERGTPVNEILKDDPEALKNAPQVVKDEIKKQKSGTRSFSTMARRMQGELSSVETAPSVIDPAMLSTAPPTKLETSEPTEVSVGHKFPLPILPFDRSKNKDTRYDPVVEQLTNLMMKEGKKATAQRNMSVILNHLRTAPAPTYSPARPMLPGAPPASHLPLHPVLYITLAVDSIAPLLRIRNQRGAAGGGVALQIPVPLGLKQRRRTAFNWIIDAASKRPNRGSGRDGFATRVAEEVIAVIEGRSAIWEKRAAVHKIGTTARSNLSFAARRK